LATTGVAHAQQQRPVASSASVESRSAVPWYQRFTTSNGVTEQITGDAENDRILPPAWTLNQRWGVTVDVREAQRIERSAEGRGDQTSVGAYYHFTPSVRVGGQLSVETAPEQAPIARENTAEGEQARAGVRIESAFRF
jgi:hypothetical protein